MAPKLPINKYLHELRTQRPKSLLLVSLGNPSPKYDSTRHSVGHAIANSVAEALGGLGSPVLEAHKVVNVAPLRIADNVFFAHSETFMNLSGEAVLKAQRAVPDPFKLIIIHDDMDVDVGEVKFKLESKSFKGHNGLRDISARYQAPYARIRVGIAEPHERSSALVERFVLGKFTRDELAKIRGQATHEALAIVKSLVDAMTPPPPKPRTRSSLNDSST